LGQIEIIAETGSTNADLTARLRAGEPVAEGFWLLADRQNAGRGRQGRMWSNGTGNFMGSTVVRMTGGEPAPATLALVAGLAVYETVLPRIMLPAQLELKWPNDVLLAGGKLTGILLEREGDAVVVGIGVNLAQAPSIAGVNVASLAQFGPAPDRDTFAADLAAQFADEVTRWRSFGLDQLIARWCAAAHSEGTPLNVRVGDGERIDGSFAGLASDGALRLKLPDGGLRLIHAGDVSHSLGVN
jgi:BirA family biotin operon repressor/biotin-[acetyl-CoA-carboxylase] ligase